MGQVQGGWLLCLRMPSFSSEIEAASGVTPQNTILSTYRLGSHSRRPKLQEIVALPQPTNIGCIFSPCRSISTPNWRISIILALHTLKILLSNVDDQNDTPNIPNYSILLSNHPRPMPTTFQSADDCIVVITWQFVVCRVATSPLEPFVQFVT